MGRPPPVLPLPKRRLGRALALLLATCGLGACVAQQGAPGYGRAPAAFGQSPAPIPPTGRRVAILLPLSGGNAQLGQSMLLAARLAFEPGPPNAFDTQDTKGTPSGAAAAAAVAIAGGAGLIVGPLTAPETAAITPLATARNVPVLALTSDSTKGRPGVWPLGLTPAQQVRTLVQASLADNKRRIGAILPSNPFGDSLAAGLTVAATQAALPPPTILRYQSQASLNAVITQMAGANSPGAPPAIDSLLLGTPADATLRILPSLVAAGIGPERIRILGTALWARDAMRLAPARRRLVRRAVRRHAQSVRRQFYRPLRRPPRATTPASRSTPPAPLGPPAAPMGSTSRRCSTPPVSPARTASSACSPTARSGARWRSLRSAAVESACVTRRRRPSRRRCSRG